MDPDDLDYDDFYDDDNDYEDDDDVTGEINDLTDSWPYCCGARMVTLSADQSIESKFPSVASATDKAAAWQAVMTDNNFGFLAVNKPYEGLTKLVPGFWYVAGTTFEQEWEEIPATTPAHRWFILTCAQLFRSIYSTETERTHNLNLIGNFPYGPLDYREKLTTTLAPHLKIYNFVILAEEQHRVNHRLLIDFNFKPIIGFLNPYHDGTRCTLYMREPDAN